MKKKQFYYYGTVNDTPAVTDKNILIVHPSITPDLAEDTYGNLSHLFPVTPLSPVLTLTKEALNYLDTFDKAVVQGKQVSYIKFEKTEQGVKCTPTLRPKRSRQEPAEHLLTSTTLGNECLQLHTDTTIGLNVLLLKKYFKFYPLKKGDKLTLFSADSSNPLVPLVSEDKTLLIMPLKVNKG